MMTTSGGCPGCGAPVGDTDFACRQCGRSFVGDPTAVAASISRPAQSSYVASSPYASNPYRPPTGYGAPTTTGSAGAAADDARSALLYAGIGLFCVGFAFGWRAVFLARRALTQLPLGSAARSTAQVAFWLGCLDILGWGIGMFRIMHILGRHHH